MTSGMAGVAGTILAAYASMGIRIEYLLAASFMAAPGGILMAKIIMPDRSMPPEGELPLGDVPDENRVIALADHRISGAGPAALLPEGTPGEPLPEATHDEEKPANLIMAAAQGAQTGVRLAVAVGAMVLAFVALVALANGLLGGFGNMVGLPGLSFQALLGYLFQPVMFLLNVPWNEAGSPAACSARRSCSTNSSPISISASRPHSSARAPSPSSPSRSAASPISRRSPSRWR